eukprot:992493-Rhodomonas_salina.1
MFVQGACCSAQAGRLAIKARVDRRQWVHTRHDVHDDWLEGFGKEKFVDSFLCAEIMLPCMMDPIPGTPRVIVLVSGDGNANE